MKNIRECMTLEQYKWFLKIKQWLGVSGVIELDYRLFPEVKK